MITAMDAMGCPSVWLYVFFEFYFSAGDQPWKRQRVTWFIFHWPEFSSPATGTCMEAGNVGKEEEENLSVGGN